MSQLQGNDPERCPVPPVEILFEGLEMAAAAEYQLELNLFNGTVVEQPKVIFGEGVVPISTAKPEARKYPRSERIADWRSEGKPASRPLREGSNFSFVRSKILVGYYHLEEDLPDIDELPAEEPTKVLPKGLGRASLSLRSMSRPYDERDAERQAEIRQSIDEIFGDQEAARAAAEIPPDEAADLSDAEIKEFKAVEDPRRAAQKDQSIQGSPFFTPQSLQEYLDFRGRRKAA